VVTERLTGGAGQPKTVGRAFLACLLGAVVATTWDVVADPQMARTNLWVWEQPGEFFGVPVQNFVGWMGTSFVVLATYRAATWRWPTRPVGESSPLFAALPVIAYGALALSFVVGYSAQGEGALAVVAFFTMGALSLAALARGQSVQT
jgi:putative membrane protein